jgi:alkaline phosphatase
MTGIPVTHDVPEHTDKYPRYEDLFAQAAGTPSQVKVAAKAYRHVQLTTPGDYTATLTYHNGLKTTATWTVRDIAATRKAKNVVMFIGDGMTTNMITGELEV